MRVGLSHLPWYPTDKTNKEPILALFTESTTLTIYKLFIENLPVTCSDGC